MQMSGVPRWSSGEDSALSLLKQVCRGVSGSERQGAAELGLEWGADLVPQRGEQGGRARGRQACQHFPGDEKLQESCKQRHDTICLFTSTHSSCRKEDTVKGPRAEQRRCDLRVVWPKVMVEERSLQI